MTPLEFIFTLLKIGLILLVIIFKDNEAVKYQSKTKFSSHNKLPNFKGRTMSTPAFTSETNRIRKSPKYTEEILAIARESNANLVAFEARKKGRYGGSDSSISNHPRCQKNEISCDGSFRYRSADGTCNNLKNADWGSSFTTFARLVPAQYADGFNAPKGTLKYKELPSARLVSTTLHKDHVVPHPSLSNMVPQIGQFLDHDITLTPETDRRCCTTEKDGIDCWPIQIPENDYFYSKLPEPQTCMDFTRSAAFCFAGGSSAIREQFNINTAFIDLSQTYGSDNERVLLLRESKHGRMVMNNKFGNIPPSIDQISEIQGNSIKVDFLGSLISGDNRVNETPGLTVMHSLWLREHDRIVGLINEAYPDWNDEKMYQEARRIVGAQWQNIVYGHYLPIVLGMETMEKYKLDLRSPGRFSSYIDTLDPTIFHSFATAAYRFGHSMVNGLYGLFKKNKSVGDFKLRDTFFNSSHIETVGAYDQTLAGLMNQNMQVFDRNVAEDLTNFLFKMNEENFGADLIARNIQRGRDHGIANYDTYRQICGLTHLTTWDEKPKEFDDRIWKKLKSVYEVPTDIDLFSGGLTEQVGGGVTGPTFNCLKARQFYNSKFGDRFFFTHKNQAGSFTEKQLTILRKRTLGDIICENSDITRTTANVFITPSKDNSWIRCEDSSRTKINIKDFLD